MARNPSPQSIAESRWKFHKRQCPICKHELSNWYCPNCGIPTHNSSFCLGEGIAFHCGAPHFRSGFRKEEDYQLCDECYAPNPYKANFCKNCGKDISSQARDKHGHGWVDLGLSVLWSTEALRDGFKWNDSTIFDDLREEERRTEYLKYKNSNFGELGGSDAATHYWGEKWRTPTKEEFEELITKCTWEKCLIHDPKLIYYNYRRYSSYSSPYALKVTGPNRNSIIIPLVQDLCGEHYDQHDFHIEFWTSTSLPEDKTAYIFKFSQKIERIKTLTAKQKKANEFYESNNIRFKVELTNDESHSVRFGDFTAYAKLMEEKKRKRYPQYEKTLEQQRKILEAMGDDSQERWDNAKKDKEKLDNMWLKTPICFLRNKDNHENMLHIRPERKVVPTYIRPVADKKWQGKL